MKDFFKMLLAVLVGLMLSGFIYMIMGLSVLGTIAVGTAPVALSDNMVLKIDMSRVRFDEQTMDMRILSSINNEESAVIGLWDAVQTIGKAAQDPAVKCLYLKTDGGLSSIVAMEEIRKALGEFRTSGKPVVAYMENPTPGSCFLSSAADKVYLSSYPGASYMMNGISTQMIFVKDLLDKLGVNVQLIRHGKYKSAGEMFVRNSPSADNLEQYTDMVNSMWTSISAAICESRGIPQEDLDAAVDGLKLRFPEDFVSLKLADKLVTREELRSELAMLTMVDSFEKVNIVPFADYMFVKKSLKRAAQKNKIAVIYAHGDIVDAGNPQDVCGDDFARMIASVRSDSSVKAVVLRVNSPGGSVTASSKIQNEIQLLRKNKPVIASFGDYAASGGYWISAESDFIFTDRLTLTGSIGVFGMIPDLSRTMKEVAHVNVTSVGSHKHSDMYGLMRPFDAEEYAYMQASIEDIYDKFVGIVAEGRSLKEDFVDSVGQGRVWTGQAALAIGLADETGTLADAIRYAASVAGNPNMSEWAIEEYPKAPTPVDALLALFGGQQGDADDIRLAYPFASAASSLEGWYRSICGGQHNFLFARLPFAFEAK